MLNPWSEDVTSTVRLWSLTDDALVEDGPRPDTLVVLTRWGEFELTDTDHLAAECLRRMGFGPVSLRNALPEAAPEERARAAVWVEHLVDRLGCVVVHSLALPDGQGALLSAVPVAVDARFRPVAVPRDRALRLSRFATLRPVDGLLVLEVPSAPFQVRLRMPTAQVVVAALAEPSTVARLAAVTATTGAVVADLVSFLVGAGVLLVEDADGGFVEDTDPALVGWSHHELLFHQHTTGGGGEKPPDDLIDAAAGAPSPVVRPNYVGRRIALPVIDAAAADGSEPTLGQLLILDHECPHPENGELTVGQLGALLHQGARVRDIGPAHVPMRGGVSYEASQRPYFSIGCLYELELYLAIGHCAGTDRGIYHYDPAGHALTLITDEAERLELLLDRARVGAGSRSVPAASLVVTARLPRTAWLLGGSTYATALVHSGALLQTLYLVGHVVGLDVHAVVSDGSRTAADLLDLDGPDEVTLSECVLEPVRTR